jgi:hypothetical protein
LKGDENESEVDMVEKNTMTAKGQVLKAIEALPTDASIEDAMDELLYLLKIDRGLADIEAGRTVSHEEALDRMRQWRK